MIDAQSKEIMFTVSKKSIHIDLQVIHVGNVKLYVKNLEPSYDRCSKQSDHVHCKQEINPYRSSGNSCR